MPEPVVYASELSPFGARVRIAVAAKRLPIAFLPPPGPPRSAERLALTPLARFPVLVDGDRRIVESIAILGYLDEHHPESDRLAPADPFDRAVDRSIASAFDNYVFPTMAPIFGQLTSPTPDPSAALRALDQGATTWADVARLFEGEGLSLGGKLTVADCAMAPFGTLFSLLATRFDGRSPMEVSDRLADWFAAALRHDAVVAADARIRAAFAAAFPA